MNELKPEDVMRELELKVQRYLMPNVDIDGTVQVEDAERWFLKLLKEELAPYISALLREKDAETERLKNSITFQVVMPDEKMEEIKNDCLERVELDVKAAKDKFAEETIEWCRKKLKFGKYQTIGLSGKRLEGYEAAMKAVMSYMHSLKSKDDFPNCKISGCEAARKDCHIGCPYGKENTSENS